MPQVEGTSWPKRRGRTRGAATGGDPSEGAMQISVMSQSARRGAISYGLAGESGRQEKAGLDRVRFPPSSDSAGG